MGRWLCFGVDQVKRERERDGISIAVNGPPWDDEDGQKEHEGGGDMELIL